MSMRTRCSVAAFLLALTVACGSGSGGAGEARSPLKRVAYEASDATGGARSVDQLGLALLHANAGTTQGNVALSPWSIAIALGMARAGAKGSTAAEMDTVLHSTDATTLDQALNALDQELVRRNGSFTAPDGKGRLNVEVSAANRAFVQKGFAIDASFLDTLASRYGVGVGLVDYKTAAERARRDINGFVAKQTHDKIPELIPKDELSGLTRLVLVDAVYLDADWAVPFRPNDTVDGTFHAPGRDVQARMMHSDEVPRRYAQGDGWRGTQLDYAGAQLAMTIVLPDADRFDEIATKLDASVLDAIAAADEQQVLLTLPKFHVHKAIGLKDQLSALGMPTAFDPGRADFSGITTQEPLFLSDVLHEADVAIDEKGTVAAAATADVFDTIGGPIGPELIADRPFLFFVRDTVTGAILFAGQVTDPTA